MKIPARCIPRLLLSFAGLGLITVSLGSVLIALSPFCSPIVPYKMTRFWARMISACAGITVSIKGAENMAPGQSYIITPNHQSHMDILAYLQKLPHPFRWVGKRSLLSIPFFGWALAATGAIGIDRSKKEEAVRILRDSYSKLEGGWSVLIYPEGTRSRDGGLGDFKKGAFMMAVQSGAPILPVTANGAFNILPRGTLALTPGHIEIIVGEPIPVDGLTEKDVPALMEKTRAVIERNLKPPTA